MAEYIDRNKLLKVVHLTVAEAHNERCAQLLEAILDAPAADVVSRGELSIVSAQNAGLQITNNKLRMELDVVKVFAKSLMDNFADVVRCKECKFLNDDGICFKNIYGISGYKKPNPDDYCNYGERKGDDGNNSTGH